ncbi:MAG: SCP2 sterol-binding domain-containing protein [Xanthomonadaceae bacterium]|nr:SCP2 sterol-binding domain-containing protein [Xanthomonadaceae bacterium]MDE1884780.1 SCP2 sterol-binding domain-containing protein [Xanthomonadaceae bacterium]MDE1960018.1 SCP2 sterol-binding domain-containing protein [Xanthomonadaceae bacterium]MDE2083917.1 SCP2 sterol-binding domain-containing protein [Xanthomonadaceae bacterium]MDE2256620.1 SCP2 sterol-binding domain-containing protein [Xanthomonadaceae bacterium]
MADTARQPDPLLARLGTALEGALNRALALDPEFAANLAALEGRRIGVELRGMNLALAIAVRDGRLCVGPHWESAPDLNVRAAPASLLAFALRRGEDAPLPPGKVEISGDAQLARTLEKAARQFRPDFEEAFAKTFGDVLGVALARALRGAFAYARESAQTLAQDTAEFLREESRDLVAPAEMESFLDDVDTLRERADRLAARIDRVTSRGDGG